jgi:hypothetical protein
MSPRALRQVPPPIKNGNCPCFPPVLLPLPLGEGFTRVRASQNTAGNSHVCLSPTDLPPPNLLWGCFICLECYPQSGAPAELVGAALPPVIAPSASLRGAARLYVPRRSNPGTEPRSPRPRRSFSLSLGRGWGEGEPNTKSLILPPWLRHPQAPSCVGVLILRSYFILGATCKAEPVRASQRVITLTGIPSAARLPPISPKRN